MSCDLECGSGKCFYDQLMLEETCECDRGYELDAMWNTCESLRH